MKKPLIVGLGEILWDIFPEYKRTGGAPVNVAFHASRLRNNGIPASRIGNDEDGKELLSVLSSHSIDTSYIQLDDVAPTGTVEVSIRNGEASYIIHENVAWDRLSLTTEWQELAERADAICFGTLAQRDPVSRKTIHSFLSSSTGQCLKVADINLREPHYSREIIESTMQMADVVKMNQQEWQQLEEMFNVDDLKSWLFNEINVRFICLTKGIEGAELMTPDQHLVEPVHPVDSINGDSVGAGDAFTASLTHHLLRNSPLDVGISAATRYAAHVAARKGAMPDLPDAVIDSVV